MPRYTRGAARMSTHRKLHGRPRRSPPPAIPSPRATSARSTARRRPSTASSAPSRTGLVERLIYGPRAAGRGAAVRRCAGARPWPARERAVVDAALGCLARGEAFTAERRGCRPRCARTVAAEKAYRLHGAGRVRRRRRVVRRARGRRRSAGRERARARSRSRSRGSSRSAPARCSRTATSSSSARSCRSWPRAGRWRSA